MGKYRYILGPLLAVLALGCAWHYAFRLPWVPLHPMEAVPVQTGIFWRFDHLDAWRQSRAAVQGVLPQKGLEEQRVWQAVAGGLGLDLSVAGSWPALWLTPPGPENAWGLILDTRGSGLALSAMLAARSELDVRTVLYRNEDVHLIRTTKYGQIAVAQYRNLLLVGSTALAVEECIGQIKSPRDNLWRQRDFRRMAAAGQAAMQVFVQPAQFKLLAADMALPAGAALLSGLGERWRWLALGISPADEGWSVAGMALMWPAQQAKEQHHAGVPRNSDLYQYLPSMSAVVYHTALPDVAAWLRAHGAYTELFAAHVAPWVGHEYAVVYTDPVSSGALSSRVGVLACRYPQEAKASIERLAGSSGVLKTYTYGMFDVLQLSEDRLFSGWPGLEGLSTPCLVLLGDYLLICPSTQVAENWIDQYIIGNTLDKIADFQVFASKNDKKSQHIFMVQPAALPLLFSQFFSDELLPAFVSQFQWMELSSVREGEDALRIAGFWPFRPPELALPTSHVLWRAPLAAPLATAPQAVDTHTGPNILVQDTLYNLYCLDASGQKRWQLPLEGRVLSEFHLVDYNGDGGQQLLFNTAKAVYLLDMGGGHAADFPLMMQSAMTTALTVVDFDGNGDFSFFVACENGQIYGFSKKRQPLPGWNPMLQAGRLSVPLLHVQEPAADFLLTLSREGRLSAYRRDGSLRFPVVETQSAFASPLYAQTDLDSLAAFNRIVAVDIKGMVTVLNTKGDRFRLRMEEVGTDSVRSVFVDVWGDARKDYLALSGNKLSLYGYEGTTFKRQFGVVLPLRPDAVFSVRLPESAQELPAVVHAGKQQIFLFKADGSLWRGFPLAGDTAFDAYAFPGTGAAVLVTGLGAEVYAYRLGMD